MKSAFLLFAPLLLCGAPGATPRVVDYEIAARLDPKARAVEGSETLTWHNESPDEIRELRFHLYMNAFRNDKSTFLRESGGAGQRLKDNGWGWIDVKRLRIAGGADLTKGIRYLHPDDDNAGDRTVMAVTLPQPVRPGRSLTLAIDFYTKLPHVAARAGYHGEFYFVAQWFPKIGVWEKAGDRYATRGQWNCHQYHATSEFYADYGRYAVEITVPSDYVVGATGVLESRREDAAAKTTAYYFVQQDVHDFAWTASPVFQRFEQAFDPAREVTAAELAHYAELFGIPESEVGLDPVRMILLLQPEHARQAERHFKALRAGLKYFGLWYGKYPYRTITLVDPPWGGHQAGGMEYPTLITAGTRWLISDRGQITEDVTVHEFGHQYWYGLVGNNEFEEAWLDEGFDTYSTGKVLDQAYGPAEFPLYVFGVPAARWLGLPLLSSGSISRNGYLSRPKADSLLRNSWEYYDAASYGVNSYERAAITLGTLERWLGEDTMARVMRTYHQRWRYRHPTTLDFLKVVNEVSGKDMKWFFDQFVYGSNVLDYKVGSVSSSRTEDRKLYDCVVKIRREGEAVMPVDIRIRFKDGQVVTEHWDGQYRWAQYKYTRGAAIESVEIDPEHKLLLDANFANNSYRAEFAAPLLLKWAGNLLFWAQNLLLLASAVS